MSQDGNRLSFLEYLTRIIAMLRARAVARAQVFLVINAAEPERGIVGRNQPRYLGQELLAQG
jgi:hypothetical protein